MSINFIFDYFAFSKHENYKLCFGDDKNNNNILLERTSRKLLQLNVKKISFKFHDYVLRSDGEGGYKLHKMCDYKF
jgi:hypothetical protein